MQRPFSPEPPTHRLVHLGPTADRRAAWAVAHHRAGPVHGVARQPRRDDSPPGHPGPSPRRPRRPRVDRQRLHVDLCRAAPVGCRLRGAIRSPAGIRCRHRRLHAELGGSRPGSEHRLPRGGAGIAGCRRGDDHAAVTDVAERRGDARAPQRRLGDLGGDRWSGRGARTARGGRRHKRLVVALHLLVERACRSDVGAAGVVEAGRVPREPEPAST